jgi:hypothetical protein
MRQDDERVGAVECDFDNPHMERDLLLSNSCDLLIQSTREPAT